MGKVDPKVFWDRKILQWEHDKYVKPPWGGLFDVNAALKGRMSVARGLLRHATGLSVVELGCGSGFLLPYLKEVKIRSYLGVDLSKVALEAARERAAGLDLDFHCEFVESPVQDFAIPPTDLCFSLGLLDWLSLEEAGLVLADNSPRYFFHSFSERQFALKRLVHQAYVFSFYGHKSGGYVPKYWRREDLARAVGGRPLSFLSDKKLGLGAIVHNLPDEWLHD